MLALESPLARGLAVLTLLAVLVGLLVAAGTVAPDPLRHHYPDEVDIAEHLDRYVGERVTVSGAVVATDPVTVAADAGPHGTISFVLAGIDGENVAVGDQLSVHGTLEPDGRVTVIDAVARAPWEYVYMYLVSLAGGLWVLARLINRWRLDTAAWAIVPRERPLVVLR